MKARSVVLAAIVLTLVCQTVWAEESARDEFGALKYLEVEESTETQGDPPNDETVLGDLTFAGRGGRWWHRVNGDAGIVVDPHYKALMIVGSDQGSGRHRWTRMWDTVSIEGRLILGWKWTLSGVGDRHANDGWMRMFGMYPNNQNYWGGFAASKFWSYAYYHASDKELKENISPVTGALHKIKNLNGVHYNFKDFVEKEQGGVKAANKQIGLIAQEVQKEFPEAVSTGANGFLAIDYGKMVAPVVQAMKEHHRETQGLEKELSQHVEHTARLEKIASEQGSRLAALEEKLAKILA